MDLPLAAYGTLRPGCGGLEHLGIQVEVIGPCRIPGRLWLVSDPVESGENCLVPAYYPDEEGMVEADLLHIPEAAWGTIDRWEDFTPHDPSSSYTRQEITTESGEQAWAYVAGNIARINFLRSGDWKRYASHPKARPLFHTDQLYTPR